MSYEDEYYRFQHNFDYGRVDIAIPKKMSADDVIDLESHFELILKQLHRKLAREKAPATVAELEALLNSEDDRPITINRDGSISPTVAEHAGKS